MTMQTLAIATPIIALIVVGLYGLFEYHRLERATRVANGTNENTASDAADDVASKLAEGSRRAQQDVMEVARLAERLEKMWATSEIQQRASELQQRVLELQQREPNKT